MPAPVLSKIPRVPVSYEVALAQETDEAILIASDAEITIPLLFGIICLLGWLYGAKYLLIPLLKLIKVPGTNWFSEFVNFVLGAITKPVEDYAKALYAWIAHGIDAHTRPFTNFVESAAWIAHDSSITVATTFAQVATALHTMRHVIIPDAITTALKPIRLRLGKIEAVIASLNATAKRNGFRDYQTAAKVQVPQTVELGKAETYVRTQGHKSLAGALSVFQTTTTEVGAAITTVKRLKYYDLPSWITHITTEITKIVPDTIKKLTLRVGKIEHSLSLNSVGVPFLLAAMSATAVASFFRKAIPEVCTEVGDCAASNLIGRNNWNWLKDLLGLLLAASIDALALADLCAIAKLAQSVASDFEPELRDLAVVAGGLSSIGCASPGVTMGAPLY